MTDSGGFTVCQKGKGVVSEEHNPNVPLGIMNCVMVHSSFDQTLMGGAAWFAHIWIQN